MGPGGAVTSINLPALDVEVFADCGGRTRFAHETRDRQYRRDVREDQEYFRGQLDEAESLGAKLGGVDEAEKERGYEDADGPPASGDIRGEGYEAAAVRHALGEGVRVLYRKKGAREPAENARKRHRYVAHAVYGAAERFESHGMLARGDHRKTETGAPENPGPDDYREQGEVYKRCLIEKGLPDEGNVREQGNGELVVMKRQRDGLRGALSSVKDHHQIARESEGQDVHDGPGDDMVYVKAHGRPREKEREEGAGRDAPEESVPGAGSLPSYPGREEGAHQHDAFHRDIGDSAPLADHGRQGGEGDRRRKSDRGLEELGSEQGREKAHHALIPFPSVPRTFAPRIFAPRILATAAPTAAPARW